MDRKISRWMFSLLRIHVLKSSLRVPVKVFYLILILGSFLLLLVVQMIDNRNLRDVAACTTNPPEKSRKGRLPFIGDQHSGCSQDPVYFNTWKSCPACFGPMAAVHSRHFHEVPKEKLRFPRVPHNFLKPTNGQQQDVVRRVLISPQSVCRDPACPYLVALQPSVTDKVDVRNSVRSTWGSAAKTKVWPHAHLNVDMQLIFVLAHQSVNRSSARRTKRVDPVERDPGQEEWSRVLSEADKYGDILYFDMIDSYYNLTLKLLSALNWVHDHCRRTKFFIKVDDDTFLNVPLLLNILIYNEGLMENSLSGFVYDSDRKVERSGRWAVSKKLYSPHMYPVYIAGCSYVLSRGATHRILDNYPSFTMLHLEDVFITGILGRVSKVKYIKFKGTKPALFAEFYSGNWDWCYFLNDTIISGTGVNRRFKAMTIWSGYVYNDWICRSHNLLQMNCHCEKEFRRK